MFDPFDGDHNSYWIPYADFLAGVAMIFLVTAIMMLFHLSDPKQKNKEGEITAPGTVMVEMFWKENADVDLWVKSPNDVPVGYSRKQGKYFDLLRDDMGWPSDKVAGLHHENAFSRNAAPGEYIVNVHMYSDRGPPPLEFPVEVEIAVQIVRNPGADKSALQKVIKTKIQLIHMGEEITVVRFQLNDRMELIPDSINQDQIPLRAGKK